MSEPTALAEVVRTAERWRAAGRRAVLARVVATHGSAPRPPGTTMAVADDGEVAGSLTGGCVEAAVVQATGAVLAGGEPVVAPFAYGDELALEAGLSCGGEVQVLVTADLPPSSLVGALEAGEAVAAVTRIGGGGPAALVVHPDGSSEGSLGDADLDARVRAEVTEALGAGDSARSGLRHYPSPTGGDDTTAFVEVHLPPPVLVVVGAVDAIAVALVRLAATVGYRTVVCDPRATFATAARFPDADEVVTAHPGQLLAGMRPALGPNDAVCVLTHRMPFDVPAVQAALATGVGYLGALGSRATAATRAAELTRAGVSEDDLARLHAPIGLDLGARTPTEIALAILAEMVAARRGGTGTHLHAGTGSLHAGSGS